MKRYVSLLLMLVLATFVMAPGWAQAGSGFYISSDLGLNVSQSMEFVGDSNDVASHCDALTNPGLMGCRPVGHSDKPDGDYLYTGNFAQDAWWADFDGGSGILAGAAVGYSFADQNPNGPLAGFRVEMEYFYRETKYDQTTRITRSDATTEDKIKRGEFGESGPNERLGSITSHNLFGNVFYDFVNTSRFTPYIGIGGGLGFTEADYSANWTRTLNKATLRDGLANPREGTEPRPDLAANPPYIDGLAGSSSVVSTSLSDTLWGFQVLFGVDYAITEAMSLGLKGRYVMFNDFKDGIVWDPLRSHAPYVGGTVQNPTNPVSGHMSTSDIQFFGISLNLKYHF